MRNIFRYIASILVVVSITTGARAQTEAPDTVTVPLWQGFDLETDLVPLVTNLLNDPGNYRYEALVRFNLKNKYYPVVELGYESRHAQLYSGIDYQGSGLFYRVGLDFNLIRPVSTKAANNKFLIGARLGMSDFSYDLRNIPFTSPFSGLPGFENRNGLRTTGFWFEIVAGIRIEIFDKVMMGWTARTRNELGEAIPGAIGPYYLPGFGKAGSGVWALNYSIGYQF